MPSFEDHVVRRRDYVREQAVTQAVAERLAEHTAPPAHPLVTPLMLVVADEHPVGGEQDWTGLPEPFADTLRRLLNIQPGWMRCWRCSAPVGRVLFEQTEQWATTGLLYCPRTADQPVNLLCATCTPMLTDLPAEIFG